MTGPKDEGTAVNVISILGMIDAVSHSVFVSKRVEMGGLLDG